MDHLAKHFPDHADIIKAKEGPLYVSNVNTNVTFLLNLEACIILDTSSIHTMCLVNILSRATNKGAPINSGMRTYGGLKVVFPHTH